MHGYGGEARTHGRGAALVAVALLGMVACGQGETPKAGAAKVVAAPQPDPAPVVAAERAAPTTTAGEAKTDAVSPGPSTDTGAQVPAADTTAATTTATAEPDPVPGLLAEAKRKRTKDERALVALDEAEKAGASPRDLAKAAQARGRALYATPERARKFFEWAAAKDPKYADPMFSIAKQYAMLGDVPMVKEYLTKVRERGGKKLLAQIEFDPTWEIVKDDPDVRALLK